MQIEFPAILRSFTRALRRKAQPGNLGWEATGVEGGRVNLPAAQPHPSLSIPVQEQSRYTAQQAWETALSLLKEDMPRSAYERWVLAAELSRFDPARLCFTAVTPNYYLQALLAERVAPRLEQHLLGICGRAVRVRFIARPGSR